MTNARMRRALLTGFCVTVGLAGAVTASERVRDSATGDDSRVAAPPADFKIVSPGVGVGTWNGKQVQVGLKATVSVSEAEAQSGSVDRFLYDQSMRNVPTMEHGGETYAMSAVIGAYPDVMGSKVSQPETRIGEIANPTVADFKARFEWVERTVGGETVTLYLTPLVINDPSMVVSQKAQLASRTRSMIFNGRRVFLSGVIFPEDFAPLNGNP